MLRWNSKIDEGKDCVLVNVIYLRRKRYETFAREEHVDIVFIRYMLLAMEQCLYCSSERKE